MTQQVVDVVHPVGTPVVALSPFWLTVKTNPVMEPVPVAVMVKAVAEALLQVKVKNLLLVVSDAPM